MDEGLGNLSERVPVDLRGLLVALTSEDWGVLSRAQQDEIRKRWSRPLDMYMRALTFGTPLVRQRLSLLPAKKLPLMAFPLWHALGHMRDEAASEDAFVERLGPRLLAVADLPATLFGPRARNHDHGHAPGDDALDAGSAGRGQEALDGDDERDTSAGPSTEGDSEAASSARSRSGAKDAGDPTRGRLSEEQGGDESEARALVSADLIALLETSVEGLSGLRGQLETALEATSAAVRAGVQAPSDWLPVVDAWNRSLAEAARLAGTAPELAHITQSWERMRQRLEAQTEDELLLARVLRLHFPETPEAIPDAFAEIYAEVRRAEAPLEANYRQVLEAFLRVVTAPDGWDEADLELLLSTHGIVAAAMAVRVNALADPDPLPPSSPGSMSTAVIPKEELPHPAESNHLAKSRKDSSSYADRDRITENPVEQPVAAESSGVEVDVTPQVSIEAELPIEARGDLDGGGVPSEGEGTPRRTADSRTDEQDGNDSEPAAEAGCHQGISKGLASGDFARAFWYAVAGDDALLARALELLAVATGMDPQDAGAQMRCRSLAAQIQEQMDETSGSRLKAIAAVLSPAAVLLPQYSEAAIALNEACRRLGDNCPEFVRLVDELAYQNGAGISSMDSISAAEAQNKSRERLLAFQRVAKTKSTRLQRATEVWRELVRDHGVLGAAINSCLNHPEDVANRALLREYADTKDIDKLIRATDLMLSPLRAKTDPIIAGARVDLRELILQALSLMQALLDAGDAVRAHGKGSHLRLQERIRTACRQPHELLDLSDHVVASVAGWLDARLGAASQGESARGRSTESILMAPLWGAYELVRDREGGIDPSQVTVELLDLLETRTLEEAFSGFALADDQVGIAQLLEWVHLHAPNRSPEFEERERQAQRDSRVRFDQRLSEVSGAVALALSASALLSDSESQQLQSRVERLRASTETHYPSALAELDAVKMLIEQKRAARLQLDRDRLEELEGISVEARERVSSLLDSGDLVNAEEFIAQLRGGARDLPSEPEIDPTFREFWPSIVNLAPSDPAEAVKWIERLRNGAPLNGLPVASTDSSDWLRKGLDAWIALANDGRKARFDLNVGAVLDALGLHPKLPFAQFSGARGATHTTFRATYEGRAVVPSFGSGSQGKYELYMCWDRKSPKGLLEAAHATSGGRPTVILYFGTLTQQERRALAEAARRDARPYVVVDHAVMAFLATRKDARLETTIRVTLPFAGINPFTPYVLGDVPREMFYGRDAELRKVQDPNGPLFVYGGRQLGKSALLKTAIHDFRTSPKHLGLYIDLKAEGIGGWKKADDLWTVLITELTRLGVLDSKVSRTARGEVVVEKLKAWFLADPERRLLLALDECDAFLEADSQPAGQGKDRFRNVLQLKNVMDATQRRFKPVFAGLHHVQRFHTESNGPMAHVGAEIPIGPLPPTEAFKLVTRPLAAIGYEFASPDAVWRLLNHTNYQASLIQLFCNELVEQLGKRRLANDEPPSRIDAAMVDAVYSEREVRSRIAQRFEWTIQLDNRYLVIALVAAYISMTSTDADFSVDLLQEQCAQFWAAGFAAVGHEEFRVLLDEMVGLGVLVRSGSRYGIRSPNVIRLLGSDDDILRKLDECDRLELATSYDASRYRRSLGEEGRSPLTEAQLARLLKGDSLTLVIGSEALNANLVPTALRAIVRERDGGPDQVELTIASADSLEGARKQVGVQRSSRQHLFWDARGASDESLLEGLSHLQRMLERESLTVSCLLDPPQSLIVPDGGQRRVILGVWDDAGLKAIEPEWAYPLDAEGRRLVLLETGGWPQLVDSVLNSWKGRGDLAATTRDLVAAWRAKNDARSVLAATGVESDSTAHRLLRMVVDWDAPLTRSDMAVIGPEFEPDALSTALQLLLLTSLIHRSEEESDVYRLNPLAKWIAGDER